MNPGFYAPQNTGASFGFQGQTGFESDVFWQVNDQFGGNTYNTNQASVDASESIGPYVIPANSSYPDPNNNNWGVVIGIKDSSWNPAACNTQNSGPCFHGGTFVDHLFLSEPVGSQVDKPTPQNPPAFQDTFSTQLVGTFSQTFYSGDGIEGPDHGQTPAPYKGCNVQTDTIFLYIDHATESVATTTSPVLPNPVDDVVREPQAMQASTKAPVASRRPTGKRAFVEIPNLGKMLVPQGVGSILGSVPDVGFLAKDSAVIVKGAVLETRVMGERRRTISGPSEMIATIQ